METKSAAHCETCTGVLLRKLASAGVRPTRQRLDLARAIFGAGNRHFTAEMIHHETRSIRFAPTLGTIYNTLNEFARCGLLREIAIYDAKLWYDTKTGPHYHFYREDTEELSDIPRGMGPGFQDPRSRRHADQGDRRDRAVEEGVTRSAIARSRVRRPGRCVGGPAVATADHLFFIRLGNGTVTDCLHVVFFEFLDSSVALES